MKKHQEQNQSQKNKLKRAQTTNDSRTTKDTRNYQNNQEGQINLDRSFQLKQESNNMKIDKKHLIIELYIKKKEKKKMKTYANYPF